MGYLAEVSDRSLIPLQTNFWFKGCRVLLIDHDSVRAKMAQVIYAQAPHPFFLSAVCDAWRVPLIVNKFQHVVVAV
jgi:hypothetical protein